MPGAVAEARARFRRVAISHEWLTIPGGSEAVVLRMLDLFPDADVYTSVYDPRPWPPQLTDRRVRTSFLDRIPGARRHYPRLLPLMNTAFESFDLDGYDLVLSSNHACAKNVVTSPETLHACYCHTPMRYAWDPQFLAGESLGPATRVVLPALLARLRAQDLLAASRPDHIFANSTAVQARVAKYWRREAQVLHPPVDVDRFLGVPRRPDGYYLVFGRLVPYKRADLAVAACRRLGRRLKVAGEGRSSEAARALAGPEAEFLGRVPDADVPALLAGAEALIFPGEEDFGIVPVEALAAGVPVIAYGRGGALDTITDGRSGILFGEQTTEALVDAIRRFEASELDEPFMRRHAENLRPERFVESLAGLLLAARAHGNAPRGHY